MPVFYTKTRIYGSPLTEFSSLATQHFAGRHAAYAVWAGLNFFARAERLFTQPSQLTASQTWIETTLSTPVTLKAGQLYRIFLLSPQTNLTSAYRIYGHEFCYDPLIGYGSLQHQLTSSTDSGTTKSENSDADALFKLTNAG